MTGPRKTSFTSASDTALKAPLPAPCTQRQTMSDVMPSVTASTRQEQIYSTVPISSTGRRPYLSLSGPHTSMDSAKLNKKPLRVRPIRSGVTANCVVISGMAGKYKSVDKGAKEPMNVRKPIKHRTPPGKTSAARCRISTSIVKEKKRTRALRAFFFVRRVRKRSSARVPAWEDAAHGWVCQAFRAGDGKRHGVPKRRAADFKKGGS